MKKSQKYLYYYNFVRDEIATVVIRKETTERYSVETYEYSRNPNPFYIYKKKEKESFIHNEISREHSPQVGIEYFLSVKEAIEHVVKRYEREVVSAKEILNSAIIEYEKRKEWGEKELKRFLENKK